MLAIHARSVYCVPIGVNNSGHIKYRVPEVYFVADNLLTNALRKRQNEPGVVIEVRLEVQPLLGLTVADSGAPAPEHVARNLFLSPVASDFGLGVGLYQAARQAARSGFRLALPEN